MANEIIEKIKSEIAKDVKYSTKEFEDIIFKVCDDRNIKDYLLARKYFDIIRFETHTSIDDIEEVLSQVFFTDIYTEGVEVLYSHKNTSLYFYHLGLTSRESSDLNYYAGELPLHVLDYSNLDNDKIKYNPIINVNKLKGIISQ